MSENDPIQGLADKLYARGLRHGYTDPLGKIDVEEVARWCLEAIAPLTTHYTITEDGTVIQNVLHIDGEAAPHDRLCEGEDGGCFCGVRAAHTDGGES